VLYIGCPLWAHKEWLGNFFPPRTPTSDFLQFYSQRLLTVEGNTVFYALPSADTIARWVQETPPTFRFCPKVLRSISHEADLVTTKEELRLFLTRIRGLGERLGPIFLQLPPSFAPEQLSKLAAFLAFWPADLRLAVEVRHPDFFVEPHMTTLNLLLQQYNVARVIMDTRPIHVGSMEEQQILQARERKPHLPVHVATTTNFAFVRYIGHPRLNENLPFLDFWAQQLAQWLQAGMTLYVFCHCPFEKHSPEICYELYQRVHALFPLPALSWNPEWLDEQPEQMHLF
jgi:uncharacterized protein YecE (DUF72 family)